MSITLTANFFVDILTGAVLEHSIRKNTNNKQ